MNSIFLKKIIFLPFVFIIFIQAMEPQEEKIEQSQSYLDCLPKEVQSLINFYCQINDFRKRQEKLTEKYYVKNMQHLIKGGLYCKAKNPDKQDIHLINSTEKHLNNGKLFEYHDYFLWGPNEAQYNLFKSIIDNYSVEGSDVILHELCMNCYYILRVNLEKQTQKMMHVTTNKLLLSGFSRDKKTLATLEKKAENLQLIIHKRKEKINDNLIPSYLPYLKKKSTVSWQELNCINLGSSKSQDFLAMQLLEDFNAIALLKNDGNAITVPLDGKFLTMSEKSNVLDKYFPKNDS